MPYFCLLSCFLPIVLFHVIITFFLVGGTKMSLQIKYFGPTPFEEIFSQAFHDSDRLTFSAGAYSETPAYYWLSTRDYWSFTNSDTGAVTRFGGFIYPGHTEEGFPDPSLDLLTIQSVEYFLGGTLVMATGYAQGLLLPEGTGGWTISQLANRLEALGSDTSNKQIFDALYPVDPNERYPSNFIDAREAVTGFAMPPDFIGRNFTFHGSDFADTIWTTSGLDYYGAGASDGHEVYYGSGGGLDSSGDYLFGDGLHYFNASGGYYEIDYRNVTSSIFVDIDTFAYSTISIDGAEGTIEHLDEVMETSRTAGFGISGSSGDDIFDVSILGRDVEPGIDAGRRIDIYGRAGNDVFILETDDKSVIRVSFDRLDGKDETTVDREATQGVRVNLLTGVISEDGHGFQDQITVIPDSTIEISGTVYDDRIIAGDSDTFLVGGFGNDTLIGGSGVDTAVFDFARSSAYSAGVGACFVNVGSNYQDSTGALGFGGPHHGVGLQVDTVINVEFLQFTDGTITLEEFRGNQAYSHMLGTEGDDYFPGCVSSDSLQGLEGDDTLIGEGGDDTLVGDDGEDRLFGGAGNDSILGGDGADYLEGGDGDDYLNPGDSERQDDGVLAGTGNDTVDFSQMLRGSASLGHWDLQTGIRVRINGNDNSGTIHKPDGETTTLINVQNPMLAWGFGVGGTNADDTFNITVHDLGWMSVSGGEGLDSYWIGSSRGDVRLDLRGGDQGIEVDLSTGRIANDGYGNAELITGGGNVTQLRTSMATDNVLGSATDETFILMAGNDYADGRGGQDIVRYNRSGVEAVQIDLRSGTATGVWQGIAFEHRLLNMEHLIGSLDGNDMLHGNHLNNDLNGSGGNDTLVGRIGNDTLMGEAGNDRLQGDEGHDSLSGDAGSDHLMGGTGHDTMDGGVGNDTLIGGKGNDTLIGGNGVDLVVFDDLAATVTIVARIAGLEIHSADGIDFVADDVETLQFGDATLTYGQASARALRPVQGTQNAEHLLGSGAADRLQAFGGDDTISGGGGADVIFGGDGNDYLYGDGQKITSDPSVSAQVYRLYQATLDRVPDAGGHLGWFTRLTEKDLTLPDAAAGFVGSIEFKNIYGALDDNGFVNLLYQNVLGRDADPGGLAGWLNALTGGTTRANVVLGFSESAEFMNSTREGSTSFTQSHTDTVWADDVYRLYQATLDRAPDLGGFEAWTDRLGSGTEFLSVVAGFVRSPEFQNTYGDLDNSQFVNLLYNNVLNREADAGGLASWVMRLDDGVAREVVVAGFSQSPEFVSATSEPLAQWVRAQGVDDVLEGGTGSNVMVGGILSDTFVFDPAQGGTHAVLDLEIWDTLKFRGFGFASDADVRAHFTQSSTSTGPNVIFVDQGVTAMFEGISLEGISDDMINW